MGGRGAIYKEKNSIPDSKKYGQVLHLEAFLGMSEK